MSSSETQRTAKPSLSLTFKSEKPHLNPKLRVAEIDTLSSKTPEKPQQFRHKSLWEPTQKQPAAQIGSARRKFDSWSEENPIETHFGASEKLPEKYEILSEFFDCLDASIRLLRLRGLMPSLTNLRPKIECLTDRRFTISHLAQLKIVLPEVIEITKVIVKDERTSDMKPDLRVTMNVDAVENDDKLKSEGGGHMHLRRAFRHRLGDISKSHPEGYEIPEDTLPPPFNFAEQHMHPDTIKCSLSSSPEALTGAHTVEQPEASKTYLQSDGIPDETHPMPPDQSKEDLNSNISGIPDPSLPNETSFEAPVITTHLPQSFRRHFSILKDEEMTAIEEQIPAISQAKRDKQMIGLPKLFDMIHFLFQSMNRSSITKEELVHKLIWNNLDFTDTNEVEEQLTLLLDLVPEWISEEKLDSGGDLLLIHINKMSNPGSIRAQLEAAN